MSEQNKQIIRDLWKCLETGNFERMAQLYHPDVQYHGSGGNEMRGSDAAIGFSRVYKTAFPNMKVEVEHVVAEGDYVVSRAHPVGKHEGDLMGMPPTGKVVDLKWVMNMVRIADGKIVEEWEVFDSADMMKQLGVG